MLTNNTVTSVPGPLLNIAVSCVVFDQMLKEFTVHHARLAKDPRELSVLWINLSVK